MNIRTFQLGDTNALRLCLNECSRESAESPWSLADLCAASTKPQYQLRVVERPAEQGVGIIAYCLFSVISDECNLLYLAVMPAMQRHGIGRQLIEDLLGQCRQHNVGSVFLEVRESNHAAIALYMDNGFIEVGSRPNYYPRLRNTGIVSSEAKQAGDHRETARLYCYSFNTHLA